MQHLIRARHGHLAWRAAAAALAAAWWLTACGGGDGSDALAPARATGTAVVDPTGGAVWHEDGAMVRVPPGAFPQALTLQIAKDGSGAPPLPETLEPVSAVYAITPHGGGFDRPVEVMLPVNRTSLADNEQLLLVTASPGSTSWRVLSGARLDNGQLRAAVAHFSYFQAVVIRDQPVPALVVTIDGRNNTGDGGARLIAPDADISTGVTHERWDPATGNSTFTYVNDGHALTATLRFPAAPLRAANVPAQPCAPANPGHDGAAWRFQRGAQILATPSIVHAGMGESGVQGYPATEAQAGTLVWGAQFAGFGALHFYGQDNPRRGALAGPAGDPWATPPSGNTTADDVLSWRGWAHFDPALHNGAMLVSVTVPTVCGLFIEAAPLMFRVNEQPGWGRFDGLHATLAQTQAVAGEPVSMSFQRSTLTMAVDRVEWQFSTDQQSWRAVPAGVAGHGQDLTIASPNLNHVGHYRAFACGANLDPDLSSPSTCVAGRSTQLVLVPGGPPEVFMLTADPTTAEGQPVAIEAYVDALGTPVTLSWQKRTVAAAAFGFGAWTDVTGQVPANSSCNNEFADFLLRNGGRPVPTCTLSRLTVTPRLDEAYTQYRMVATNNRGTVASAATTLFVTEQPTAPTVASQPTSMTVPAGGSAAFVATVTGARPLNYQWQFNETDLVGANSASLVLNGITAAQAGRYRLVVRNAQGAAVTLAATLTVTDPASAGNPVPPVIAAPPIGVAVTEGQTTQLTVGVTGIGPLSYQWFKDGAPIAGANGAALGFSPATVAQAGSYTVRVSNAAGAATSGAAVLVVNAAPLQPTPLPPLVGTPPASLAVLPGAAATLAVAATGSGPLSYQWLRDGTPLAGATGAVLHLSAVSALDAGRYSVQVSNVAGTVVSGSALLVVIGMPAITSQPQAQTAAAGATVTFSVAASGSALGYQWTRDGVAIPGATAASYTTPALSPADSGINFGVIVYNGAGVVVSQAALLTVQAAPQATPAQARGKIAAAYLHTCAITASNAVACWGHNGSGQIGTGSVQARTTPFVWSLPEAAVQVAAGANGSCAVTAGGTVWCSGTPLNTLVPTQLGGFSGVRQVAVGQMHTCVLASDTTVWCWGANGAGMLGNGSTAPSATPVQVRLPGGAPLTGAHTLRAGLTHTCAALDDYTTRCWGTNTSAQSGAPAGTATLQATAVSGADYTDELALGSRFSCAYIGEGGMVSCWGLALDGSATTQANATAAFIDAPAAVGAGEAMACAITAGGGVRCWGTGMMGNGNVNESQAAPTAVGGLAGALAMAGGQGHSCVLRQGGSLVCWGGNDAYQLGTGDSVARTTPTEVTLAGGFWRP